LVKKASASQKLNLKYKPTLEIQYRRNTSTANDILIHLKKCDGQFIPRLSLVVDLNGYASKIYANADRFEAWQNNKLVCLVAAYFNDTVNAVGFITNVSINKKYLGCGIASALLTMCIDHAKTHSFKCIDLEVNKNNRRAIKLYKKFGFVEFDSINNNLKLKLITAI
jgi:ribosomal-protein-alanine N-acetyltransferase